MVTDPSKLGEVCGKVLLMQYSKKDTMSASFITTLFNTDKACLHALNKMFSNILVKM